MGRVYDLVHVQFDVAVPRLDSFQIVDSGRRAVEIMPQASLLRVEIPQIQT